MASPVSELRMQQIATDACEAALTGVTSYQHTETEKWNGIIIDRILKAMLSESQEKSAGTPGYKFIVNSTIIQTLSDTASSGTESEGKEDAKSGRVGMHCASGAYWNNEKDGMWSWKYNGVQALDVVISVMWLAV